MKKSTCRRENWFSGSAIFMLVALFALVPTNLCAQITADEKYEMVWSDEFDGDSLDLKKWKFETGAHGWGNNEWQNYTDGKNVEVSGGTLKINAIKTGKGQKAGDYTSARLNTIENFTYGRVEVRAKMPNLKGKGSWPAIWMLGADIKKVAVSYTHLTLPTKA